VVFILADKNVSFLKHYRKNRIEVRLHLQSVMRISGFFISLFNPIEKETWIFSFRANRARLHISFCTRILICLEILEDGKWIRDNRMPRQRFLLCKDNRLNLIGSPLFLHRIAWRCLNETGSFLEGKIDVILNIVPLFRRQPGHFIFKGTHDPDLVSLH
jgi:hypothetical protein